VIEIDNNIKVDEVRKQRFDDNISLVWNPTDKTIQYKNDDEEIEKELSGHEDTIVGVYKLDDDNFLTLSKNNCK